MITLGYGDRHRDSMERDVNPLLVYPEGREATVTDCRMILKTPDTEAEAK